MQFATAQVSQEDTVSSDIRSDTERTVLYGLIYMQTLGKKNPVYRDKEGSSN